MDMGPRLLVVRGEVQDVESEHMRTSQGERNVAVNKEESSSVITMNVRASLSTEALLHMLTELIYFVLYMHQQMPCTYEELQNCCLGQGIVQTEVVKASSYVSASSQHPRSDRGRERREASSMRKLIKLKHEIEQLVRSLQSCLSVLSDIRSVLLLLGASPVRPKQIYEVQLDCQVNHYTNDTEDRRADQSKIAADLSRKLIRALISDGAASAAEGTMRLFLVVRASANSGSVPRDFHPKRGFLISSKKVAKTSVHLVQQQAMNLEDEVSSISLSDRSPSQSQDMDISDSPDDEDHIWYQCQHTVKGLFEGTSTEGAEGS